jgi:hypothetical protein
MAPVKGAIKPNDVAIEKAPAPTNGSSRTLQEATKTE